MKDIVWLKPDGAEMTDEEWNERHRALPRRVPLGRGLAETDERGRPVIDASFLVLFNAHDDAIDFTLPQSRRDALARR